MSEADHDERLRIDKWLWAARFFKTRSAAADAVEAGKALVNGQRVKPAKALKPGDELLVRTQGAEYTVVVRALSDRRGPASEAVKLYEETQQSVRLRAEARLTRTPLEPGAFMRGRPTKRARRQLQKLHDDSH